MRLIDADALKNKLCEDCFGDCTRDCYEAHLIKAQPTIEAEPVRHGRWINTGEIWTDMYTADEDPIYKCSVCNEEVIGGSKHFVWCPWCGAKMEGKE